MQKAWQIAQAHLSTPKISWLYLHMIIWLFIHISPFSQEGKSGRFLSEPLRDNRVWLVSQCYEVSPVPKSGANLVQPYTAQKLAQLCKWFTQKTVLATQAVLIEHSPKISTAVQMIHAKNYSSTAVLMVHAKNCAGYSSCANLSKNYSSTAQK